MGTLIAVATAHNISCDKPLWLDKMCPDSVKEFS